MAIMRTVRYRDDEVSYAGVTGENVDIPSRNPVNHHQAMNDLAAAPEVTATTTHYYETHTTNTPPPPPPPTN